MGALDDYFKNKGNQATQSGSALEDYFRNKGITPVEEKSQSKVTSSSRFVFREVAAEILPIPNPGPLNDYFRGRGYGVSNLADPYSKKPLLTFNNPEVKASQLLSERVATTFDPTVPQKLTRDVLTNGRMPYAASQKVRKESGATLDEQLDHAISLQLSGSNLSSNLKLQKEKDGKQVSVPLENSLARKVINGEISLLDAQKQIARAKGLKLEDDIHTPLPEMKSQSKTQKSPKNRFQFSREGIKPEDFKHNSEDVAVIKSAIEDVIANNFITKQVANRKGVIGNIKANLTGDTPEHRAKSVQIAMERQEIKAKLVAEGMDKDKAARVARSSLTQTQVNDINNFVLGTIGGSGQVKGAKGKTPRSKVLSNDPTTKGTIESTLESNKAKFQSAERQGSRITQETPTPQPNLTNPSLSPQSSQILVRDAQRLSSEIDSSLSNIKPGSGSQGVNLSRLNISDESKRVIQETVEDMKPRIEEIVGKRLANQEALDLAQSSSKVLNRAVGKESTLQWEAAMLKARQDLAAAAQSGTVDRNFVENLLTIKTQATDIARKLQSLSIKADPLAITSKEAILDAVLKANQNVDEILKAAEGVDFNDFKQASDFYRKFVSPTAQEWLDLVRYNSMLTSPKTHIVNVFSNFVNTSVIAPIEKTLTGSLDFLGSKLTGSQRQYFVGEAGAYLRGYYSNTRKAAQSFADVMRDKVPSTNLDTRSLPLATKGAKGAAAKVLSYPLKLLEGMDKFFMTLVKNAEEAALVLRESKGVKVPLKNIQAETSATYRVFRQELFSADQGKILDAIDQLTNTIQKLRNNDNKLVSTVAKFTVPFLRTPMNIFKQGIEYSPFGFSTLVGAANKTEQLSKAIIGSTVFTGAATLLTSGRLTWGEPISTQEKSDFRASGKQPYSLKIGDRWVSYQKLAPGIAFPISFVAMLDDLAKNKGVDDNMVDMVLTAIAKYGEFLADQSYAKSIGDLLNAAKGGEAGITRVVSNNVQQIIPFRALGGWLARMFDASQRKVDTQQSFIEQQIQQLMLNIPGLSKRVPARFDSSGDVVPANSRIINAFSPVSITKENKELAEFLDQKFEVNKEASRITKKETHAKQSFTSRYNEIKQLLNDGKIDEAKSIVESLSDEDYAVYKSLKASDKSRENLNVEVVVYPKYQEIRALVDEGNEEDARVLLDKLSDEEYAAYKRLKSKLQ